MIAAVHSPNDTSGSGRRSGSSTGNGPAGLGISGTGTLYRAADAVTMIKIEQPIPVAASQLSVPAGLARLTSPACSPASPGPPGLQAAPDVPDTDPRRT
jgi:hypothetical protein